MNDRIRELTKQTDVWCDQNLPSNWTDRVDEYLPVWNEKFAEFIVRECAEICLEANDHKNILRHFGMTDLRTAAQRVLDEYDNDSVGFKLFGALEDLRAALAEPVQEPVGVLRTLVRIHPDGTETWREEPLWIAPPQRPAEPTEPVAWRVQRSDGQYELYFLKAAAERAAECYIKRPPVEPLYTTPPQRKPLTDEEIEEINRDLPLLHMQARKGSVAVIFARAIEQAHGIGVKE